MHFLEFRDFTLAIGLFSAKMELSPTAALQEGQQLSSAPVSAVNRTSDANAFEEKGKVLDGGTDSAARLLLPEASEATEGGAAAMPRAARRRGMDWSLWTDALLVLLIPFLVAAMVAGVALTTPPLRLRMRDLLRGESTLLREAVEDAGGVEETWFLRRDLRYAELLQRDADKRDPEFFEKLMQERGIEVSEYNQFMRFGNEVVERGEELHELFVRYQRRHPEVLEGVHTEESRALFARAQSYAVEAALVSSALDAIAFRLSHEIWEKRLGETALNQLRQSLQELRKKFDETKEAGEKVEKIPIWDFQTPSRLCRVLFHNARYISQKLMPLIRAEVVEDSQSPEAAAQTFAEAARAFRDSIIASGGASFDYRSARRCLFIGWEAINREPSKVYEAQIEVGKFLSSNSAFSDSSDDPSAVGPEKALLVLSQSLKALEESAAEAKRMEKELACKDLPQGPGANACAAMSFFFRLF